MFLNTRYIRTYLHLVLLLLLCSCEEPYLPAVIDSPNRFLVVSGFINAGNTPSVVMLSRTQNLADDTAPKPELKAQVRLEEEPGTIVAQFSEQAGGRYTTTGPLNLNPARKYRLFIRTGGKDYASEFVPVKITPAIDSVSWKVENDGLQLYVNTHDSGNASRYYRWEFEDTWEFTADFFSTLEFINGKIEQRPSENEIYRCWQSGRTTNILIGNSTKLSQDVIREMPLTWIPSNSSKFRYKYSVLVKQYALTREGFEYWDILRRNTESIGTLFDPLPAQLNGNIKCMTTPTEPVIGFVAVGTVTEKRIFIKRSQLPAHWRERASGCQADTVALNEVKEFFAAGNSIPVSEYYTDLGTLVGYLSGVRTCVDCTLTGTKVKPAFWE